MSSKKIDFSKTIVNGGRASLGLAVETPTKEQKSPHNPPNRTMSGFPKRAEIEEILAKPKSYSKKTSIDDFSNSMKKLPYFFTEPNQKDQENISSQKTNNFNINEGLEEEFKEELKEEVNKVSKENNPIDSQTEKLPNPKKSDNDIYFNNVFNMDHFHPQSKSTSQQMQIPNIPMKYQNQIENMILKRKDFLSFNGDESLTQSQEIIENMKEVFSDYNKMFGNSEDKEVMKGLSEKEKNQRLLEKEAMISTADPSKKTILRLLIKLFHENDTDLSIVSEANALLKEFYNCFFQHDQFHLELTFIDSVIPCSFEEFMERNDLQELYIHYFRILLHEITEIPIEEIVFCQFKKGSISLDLVLLNINEDDPSKKMQIMKDKISNKLRYLFPAHFDGLNLKLISFLNKLSLSPLDFDTKGDINFPNPNENIQKRGGLDYYQPNNQWRRFGLRVTNLYEDNQWLTMDRNLKGMGCCIPWNKEF